MTTEGEYQFVTGKRRKSVHLNRNWQSPFVYYIMKFLIIINIFCCSRFALSRKKINEYLITFIIVK